jgi:RimJ/RimL family protein N-acetyltransferase
MSAVRRQTLTTARLLLEPVRVRHAHGLFEAAEVSRDQLVLWMPWAREMTLDTHRDYARRAESDWNGDREFHFVMSEADLILGVIGLNRDGAHSAELHYWIRTDRTGRGLVTEAGRALLRWGASALRLQIFTLWAGTENRASRRVAEKLGFRDVGPLPGPMAGGLGEFLAEGYELPASQLER